MFCLRGGIATSRMYEVFAYAGKSLAMGPHLFYTSAATRATTYYERVINFEITGATVTGIEHVTNNIPEKLIT